MQQPRARGIVDVGLRLVEALESILLAPRAIPRMRLEETVPGKLGRNPTRREELTDGLELGEGKEKVREENEDEEDGSSAYLVERACERLQCCSRDIHDEGG